MTDKTDLSTQEELCEAGIPFLVDADDLRALGLDPDAYFAKTGFGFAYSLNRNEHRAFIDRIQAMNTASTTGRIQ